MFARCAHLFLSRTIPGGIWSALVWLRLRRAVSSALNPCVLEMFSSGAVRCRGLSPNHLDQFPGDRHFESMLLRAAQDRPGDAVQLGRFACGHVFLHRAAHPWRKIVEDSDEAGRV